MSGGVRLPLDTSQQLRVLALQLGYDGCAPGIVNNRQFTWDTIATW
jgi:hypothetical protein